MARDEAGNGGGTPIIPVRQLSDVLQETYRLGGNVLVAMLMVLVLVVVAFFLAQSGQSVAGYIAFALAAAILLYLGVEFVRRDMLPAVREALDLRARKEMLNTVQSSALQLAVIVRYLNDYALMNSGQIVEAIERARVSLAGIPIVERVLALPALSHTEDFANRIRGLAEECQRTVDEVADAISEVDPSKLQAHFAELQALRERIGHDLFAPVVAATASAAATGANRIAEAAEVLASMQSMSLTLVETLDDLCRLASQSSSTTLSSILQLRGLLQHVPIAAGLLDREPVRALEDTGRSLMETGERVRLLAQDIRGSLANPTRENIQASVAGLAELRELVAQAVAGRAHPL